MGPISVGRPFPTLALFAIYAHTAQASLDGSEDDDQTLEASKVLFFSAQDDSLSKERKQRLMGTVIGMADFARYRNIYPQPHPSSHPLRRQDALPRRRRCSVRQVRSLAQAAHGLDRAREGLLHPRCTRLSLSLNPEHRLTSCLSTVD